MDTDESMDIRFLKKIEEIVLANLSNEHFGVADLEREVGLSRSQIHRKLKALTTKSITQYIREKRLDEAMKLLQKKVGTAAEIAYLVGFNSPTYFNKCFHDYFGYPPGEAHQHMEETKNISSGRDVMVKSNEKALIKARSIKRPTSSFYLWKVFGLLFILAIAVAGVFLFSIGDDPMPPNLDVGQQTFIIVFPFKNISKPENQYIAQGTYLEVSKYLKKVSRLKVIAGDEVELVQKSGETPLSIGKKYKADFIIEGSVWKEEEKFRLSIWVTDVKTGEEVFERDYNHDYKMLMNLVGEVALALVENLQVQLLPEDEKRLESTAGNNIKKYDLIWQAWQAYDNGLKQPSLMKQYHDQALRLARQALIQDSMFIQSYSVIASVLNVRGDLDSITHIANLFIEKFPDEPDGYGAMGTVYSRLKKYDQALEMMYKAIELGDENSQWQYQHMGLIYARIKRDYIKGLELMIESFNYSSYIHSSSQDYSIFIEPLMDIGLYDEALVCNKLTLVHLGGDCHALRHIVENQIAQSQFDQALHMLDSLCAISKCNDCSNYYGMVYLSQGDYEKAKGLSVMDYPYLEGVLKLMDGDMEEATRILKKRIYELETDSSFYTLWYDNDYFIAECYALLGDEENAIKWLGQAADRGFWNGNHDYMLIDPAFNAIRDDPRFQAIYEKAQKEKAQIREEVLKMIDSGELELPNMKDQLIGS